MDKKVGFDVESPCGCCVSGVLRPSTRDEDFEFDAEGETVTVHAKSVPVRVCDACGSVFIGPETARARHEAVCRTLMRLTPSEIRALRERHRMTQAEFAEITGVGEASTSRWERGRLLPSRSSNSFLWVLQQHPEVVEALRRRAAGTFRAQDSRPLPMPSGQQRRFLALTSRDVERLKPKGEAFSLVGA